MAIYHCAVPVVSAVGHETDWTLADAAADLRAPTPSAAAELAVPDVRHLMQQVQEQARRLDSAMQQQFRQKAQELERLSDRLKLRSPAHRQELAQQELAHLQQRLEKGMALRLEQCREQLAQQAARLEMLSPLKILGRGYAPGVSRRGTGAQCRTGTARRPAAAAAGRGRGYDRSRTTGIINRTAKHKACVVLYRNIIGEFRERRGCTWHLRHT